MTSVRGYETETWLSVQEASAMLGVSPATLRRWSAAGEVEAFTTPGGHRRFSLTTLRALLPDAGGAPARPAALGESPDRMVRVLRRHAAGAGYDSRWFRDLDPTEREALRVGGRAITDAVVRQLDADTRAERRAAEFDAEAAAADQGRRAARFGAGLADVVAVFVHFRSAFVAELARAAVRHGLDSVDATDLVTRGGEAADGVLAALVGAYAEDTRPGLRVAGG